MDRSIESIWKEGFLNKNALVAPKINDIYNRRSLHLIDRFQRTFKINYIYVIALALLHLGIGIIAGVPLVGLFLCILFIPLIITSRKRKARLSQIDKNVNSYLYLKSFHHWLEESISAFSKIYRIFYPLYFLGLILGVLFSSFFEIFLGDTLINTILKDPDIGLTTGWPIFWAAPLIILLILVAIYSEKIYQKDLESIYGGMIRRLEELIRDMEALRK